MINSEIEVRIICWIEEIMIPDLLSELPERSYSNIKLWWKWTFQIGSVFFFFLFPDLIEYKGKFKSRGIIALFFLENGMWNIISSILPSLPFSFRTSIALKPCCQICISADAGCWCPGEGALWLYLGGFLFIQNAWYNLVYFEISFHTLFSFRLISVKFHFK